MWFGSNIRVRWKSRCRKVINESNNMSLKQQISPRPATWLQDICPNRSVPPARAVSAGVPDASLESDGQVSAGAQGDSLQMCPQCSRTIAFIQTWASFRHKHTAVLKHITESSDTQEETSHLIQSRVKSQPPRTCTNRFGGFPSNRRMISVVMRAEHSHALSIWRFWCELLYWNLQMHFISER